MSNELEKTSDAAARVAKEAAVRIAEAVAGICFPLILGVPNPIPLLGALTSASPAARLQRVTEKMQEDELQRFIDQYRRHGGSDPASASESHAEESTTNRPTAGDALRIFLDALEGAAETFDTKKRTLLANAAANALRPDLYHSGIHALLLKMLPQIEYPHVALLRVLKIRGERTGSAVIQTEDARGEWGITEFRLIGTDLDRLRLARWMNPQELGIRLEPAGEALLRLVAEPSSPAADPEGKPRE